MKKYSLTILAALLAITGCAKFNASAPDDESDQLINFEAATYKNATKADPDLDGHQKMPVSTFRVTAFYTGDKGWEDIDLRDAVLYMPDVVVTKSGDSWIPKADYYWPKTGKLSFVGWASTSRGNAYLMTDQNDRSQFFQIKDYEVKSDIDDDLLVSDITTDKTGANAKDKQHVTEGVPMLFHHVLSKINFNAKLKPNEPHDNIKHYAFIKSMSIKQIYTTGKFIFDASANTTLNGAWTTTGDPVDRSGLYTNSTALQEIGAKHSATESELSTTEASSLLSIEGGMSVLPQELSDTAEVELSYVIYFCNDKGTILDIYEGNNETFKLNTFKLSGTTTPLNEWEQNKVYNYTVIVDPNSPDKITFDPAVVPWVDPEVVLEEEI